MPRLIFHPDIHQEIKESFRWYESKSAGLGEAFIAELESAFRIIMEMPNTWPMISRNFRRYLLNRFPFGVIYHIKKNEIYVIAVMHLSRNPNYWEQRIS